LRRRRRDREGRRVRETMPRVSVVVSTYRRLERLEGILMAWLAETPNVWLADSSGRFETALPIKHVRFSPDPGSKNRHAIALLTDGDYVIKADDDVLPRPGLIADFLKYACLCGILGLMGRTFHGPKYYGDTRPLQAHDVPRPIRVDMVGIVTFAPRKFLAFDLRGCASAIEDLFWHMGAFPATPKYVIPTTSYELFQNDAGCLFRDPKARAEREVFYRAHYRQKR